MKRTLIPFVMASALLVTAGGCEQRPDPEAQERVVTGDEAADAVGADLREDAGDAGAVVADETREAAAAAGRELERAGDAAADAAPDAGRAEPAAGDRP